MVLWKNIRHFKQLETKTNRLTPDQDTKIFQVGLKIALQLTGTTPVSRFDNFLEFG